MSRQWKLVLAIVAVLVLGAAALVKFGPRVEGVEVGKHAADYTAVSLTTGDSVSIHKSYAGKITLVNIWATWCPPCREEMPAMERLYRQLGPKGFRIVAISVDEDGPDVVRDFVKQYGITFDVLHDRTGDIQRVFQTTGFPESFVLDHDGVIVKKIIGSHPWDSPDNQKLIELLLSGE